MGKAAIYDPYLDTLGGGERYSLSFAKVLSDMGYSVDVEWKDAGIKKISEERLGIDLSKINFIPDIKKGSGYDICFWVSDGSIPLLHARKNILHFQVPFHDVDGRTLFNRMKLFRINKIVCNSLFTKRFIDKEYGAESEVIYPPADISSIKAKRKENIILYVGRFSDLVQSKRQDILIDVFKKFSKNYPDWKLILIGGSDVGGREFVEGLKKKSQGYNIEIKEGINYKSLLEDYGKAKFFWSAAGFGINDEKNPEKVEHFGITTIEAMAAGAVPLVYNAGGQKEIVKNGVDGILWKKQNELITKTKELITDNSLRVEMAKNSQLAANSFGYDKFEKSVLNLFK